MSSSDKYRQTCQTLATYLKALKLTDTTQETACVPQDSY